jgi:hypothetical protein
MSPAKKKPSRKPHPKVIAGTVSAGTIAAVLAIFGLHIPDAVAALVAAVASFAAGYLKPA